MSNHTPGPWKIHEGWIVGPDFETVADPRCIPPTDENTRTMEANAALIAAAPDLLETCKEAERVIRWAAQEATGRVKADIVGGWNHHADVLRAAIAKAEGGAE